jgi:hypothetical protein
MSVKIVRNQVQDSMECAHFRKHFGRSTYALGLLLPLPALIATNQLHGTLPRHKISHAL